MKKDVIKIIESNFFEIDGISASYIIARDMSFDFMIEIILMPGDCDEPDINVVNSLSNRYVWKDYVSHIIKNNGIFCFLDCRGYFNCQVLIPNNFIYLDHISFYIDFINRKISLYKELYVMEST